MISIENHTASSNMKCVTLQIVKEKKTGRNDTGCQRKWNVT